MLSYKRFLDSYLQDSIKLIDNVNDMPKLSIITATYNRAHKLYVNMASVLNQTFLDIEHIIIDNMSDDGTEELINDYQKNSPYSVIYIRQSDTGIYNALNKGIRNASGIWIHFLHSDDRYFSHSVLQEIFEKDVDHVDIIAAGIIEEGNIEKSKRWIPYYNEYLNYYHFPHTGSIIKKSFFEKYGYYNERYKIVSDEIHKSQHYSKAKYIIIPEPLVSMGGNGISSKMTLLHYQEKFIFICLYSPFSFYKKLTYIFYITNSFLIEAIPFYGNVYQILKNIKEKYKSINR